MWVTLKQYVLIGGKDTGLGCARGFQGMRIDGKRQG